MAENQRFEIGWSLSCGGKQPLDLEREEPRGSQRVGGAARVCQEIQVTDALEASWQGVKEKPADKLVGVKRHYLGFVVGAIILTTEADVATLARQELGDADRLGCCPK